MRIDVKTVKGKEYLQFVDVDGHIYHIGSAEKIDSWKMAFYLYGTGLLNMEWAFEEKAKAILAERFGWDFSKEEDQNKFSELQAYLGKGQSGYVGFNEWLRTESERIYDKKAVEIEEWRKAVKAKFPGIARSKVELRKTVNYNRRLKTP